MKITPKVILISIVAWIALTGLADILIPDETVVYKDRVVTKTKTVTKPVKVYEFPAECFDYFDQVKLLEESAYKLSMIPDKAVESISKARQARASGDSDAEAGVSEDLIGMSNDADQLQSDIAASRKYLDNLRTACQSKLP